MTDLVARLRLIAQTEGAEGVRALAGEMRGLARDGGEAAPKFEALADELERLAGQQSLVERFAALRKETAVLDASLGKAQATIDGLAGELDAAGARTTGFAQAQAQASAALEAARSKHAELKAAVAGAAGELKALRERARESGEGTAAYAGQISEAKDKLAALKQQSQEAGATVKTLAAEHRSGAAALREAQQAEAALAREYDGEIKSAGVLSRALGAKRETLDQTRAALKDAGVETANLAARQLELKAALAGAGQSAAAELESARALAEQRRQEAAEEQRLAAIVAASKAKMAQAARDQLEAEKRAFAESTAAAERFAARQKELAAQAAAGLDHAFGTVGVRSAAAIRQEMAAVERALQRIASEARVAGPEFDRIWAAGQAKIARLKAELDGVPPPIDRIGNGLKGIVGQLTPMAGAFATAFSVDAVARMATEFDSMSRTLAAIQGDGQAAAQELGYITAASHRLGLELGSTSRSYAGFLASVKGTPLEGEPARQIFEAVAGSMARLGKSSADTEGALLALGQMVTKNKVSMEELRQQLGDRLPGALQAAAKGAGVTVGELTKMVEEGRVLAEDLLPGMARELAKTFGNGQEVEGYAASWNRLSGTVQEAVGRLGQSEIVSKTVGLAFGAVTEVVGVLGTGLLTVAEGFGLVAKTAGVVAGALKSGDWSGVKKAIGDMADESIERISSLARHLTITKLALGETGKSARQAGADAKEASPGWIALSNTFQKVNDQVEDYAKLAVKAAEARKAEGEAAVARAQAFGTEAEQRQAQAQALATEAQALDKVAGARELEAAVLRRQAQAMQEAAAASGAASKAKQEEIAEVQKAAAAKEEEAAKARAQAEAAKLSAAAAQTESAALRDNSDRVRELRDAYELAAQSAKAINAAKAAGLATNQAAAAADLKAAQAAKLYRDALADAVASIQARAQADQAAAGLRQQQASLLLEEIRTEIELARVKGDTARVARLEREAKEKEIELAGLKAEAMRAEAQAQLALVAAKRAELEASGQLTPVKRAELDAAEAAAKAHQVEAQIAGELANRMQRLKEATEQTGGVIGGAAQAADQASGSLDQMGSQADGAAGKMDKLASSTGKAADQAERLGRQKRPGGGGNVGPDGEQMAPGVEFDGSVYKVGTDITDARGNKLTFDSPYLALYNRAEQIGGLKLRREIEQEFAARFRGIGEVGSASKIWGYDLMNDLSKRLDDIQIRKESEGARYPTTGPGSPAIEPRPAPPPTTVSAPAQPVQVSITINGRRETITTASQADAGNLVALLQQLETDMNRAH